MGLRADPVGGGQFKQAVEQIIEAESQPIKTMEARKAKETARLKLFQDFKSKFSGLEKALLEISTFRKFRDLKVDLGDGSGLVSVTLDKERAEPGQYELEIDDLANRTSAISNGFENPDDPILGMGFITFNLPDGSTSEIYIDDRDSSLHGIASIINQQENAPIRAAVIRDDSESEQPWKLLLTGKKEGEANQIDFPEFYFMDGSQDFYIDDDREAQNAQLVIDGFEIESGANDINDFLPGVNLHLKEARPDHPFIMTITEDNQKISGKVKSLIDELNQVLQFIEKQNAIDAQSDTTSTFAGDTTLQTIEFRLRNTIHQGYMTGDPDSDDSAHALYLTQLGIEFDKSGQITLKEDKFNKSIEKDFDGIGYALTGPNGFVQTLRGILDGYTRTNTGLLTIKEQALRDRIKSMDQQIDQKMTALEQKKQSLVEQFSRLEASLGNLQRQQQYLAATLPGAGGGGNIVSQLMG